MKLVSDEDGKEVVTDSSIRYDDTCLRRNGLWLFQTRTSHFSVNDKRSLGARARVPGARRLG